MRERELTRIDRVGALHSQHLQARGLGWQDGAASNCSHLRYELEHRTKHPQPHLDGRHGAGNVEVLPSVSPGLHQRDAVGAANSLGCVLSSGNVDGRYDVCCVCIETWTSSYNESGN